MGSNGVWGGSSNSIKYVNKKGNACAVMHMYKIEKLT